MGMLMYRRFKRVIAAKHFTSARSISSASGFAPVRATSPWLAVLLSVFFGIFMGFVVLPLANAQATAQSPIEFAKLVSQLAPSDGADESPKSKAAEEQALAILDGAVLPALQAASPDLDALNAALAQYVTRQPPLGEGYTAFRLSGSPATYALLADFGPDGPSAVRIYSGAPGQVALAARVDRYAQKDFLDDYIALVPWNGPESIFITAAGRTDELQTGIFTAWHFDGHQVESIWTSDVLQQSTYEMAKDGFRITFCVDPNPDDIHSCLKMQRDRYVWQDGKWKWAESTPLPGTK
jgi:hypothetical protein